MTITGPAVPGWGKKPIFRLMAKDKHQEILQEARDRLAEVQEAESKIREEARLDVRMLSGKQWKEKDLAEREAAGRPALTFNKLSTMVQSVSNQIRQNRPSITVHPEDGEANEETAKVIQGMIRQIEYDSAANVAYEHSEDCSAGGSFGAFRIVTEYASATSFDQVIRIKRILDPFTAYKDPRAQEHDGSDAKWWIVLGDRITHAEHKRRYPKAEISSFEGVDCPSWISDEDVQLAEYLKVETVKSGTLNQYADGSTGWAGEDAPLDEMGESLETVNTRESEEVRIVRYLLNGVEVLEEDEIPSELMTIIPVLGKEMVVDGERELKSLIRDARDPQILYNFYKTGIAETISLANRAPYIGYEGQFTDPRWKTANKVNYPYLEIRRESIGGQPAPFPQRQQFEPPIQALAQGAMLEADDIKGTSGIFNPSLGAEANEKSGIAIRTRQAQSNVVNFHFPDNLTRALVYAGKVLVNMIPRVYDAARQVRIIGEDEKERIVWVNTPYQDPETGKMTTHILNAGKYGVKVLTEPSSATQKDQTFEQLSQMANGNPKIMELAGDIIFRNSNIRGAELLAERWEKTLPPALQPEKKGQQQEIPQQVQQQMAQMGQMAEQLTAKVQELTQIITGKQMELDSKERIAGMQAQVELIKAQAAIDAQQAQVLLQAEMAAIQQKMEMLQSAADRERAESGAISGIHVEGSEKAAA